MNFKAEISLATAPWTHPAMPMCCLRSQTNDLNVDQGRPLVDISSQLGQIGHELSSPLTSAGLDVVLAKGSRSQLRPRSE